MLPSRLAAPLALVALTTLGWACLDFKRAYDAYCTTRGDCDGGTPDAGDGGACLTLGASCTDYGQCCAGSGCRYAGSTSSGGTCQAYSGETLPNRFACHASDECTFGWCLDGVCKSPDDPEPDCHSLDASCTGDCCEGLVCRPMAPAGCKQALGQPCTQHRACEQLNCQDGACAPCLDAGRSCDDDGRCCSGSCDEGTGICD